MSFNRLANAGNRFQGDRKKVLCVCSAGLLRSPTVAWILSNEPFGYNTRAVGTSNEYALIPVDDIHVRWADAIVFVDAGNYDAMTYADKPMKDLIDNMECHILNIPDQFPFRDEKLVEIATEQLKQAFGIDSNNKE